MYNIYCIKSKITNHIYIGRTKDNVNIRLARHIKHSYDKNHQGRIYNVMREIGRKNFYIELIETTEDKSRETYWINYYLNNQDYDVCNECKGYCLITKEQLYQEYVVNKKSSRQIAKEFNISSKTTILTLLKEFGIQERHSRKLCLDEQEVYSKYIKGESIRGLSKEYNVDRDVIKRIVKAHSPLDS